VEAPSGSEPDLRRTDFSSLQRIIERESGIFVTQPSLLVQRLTRRLRDLELDSFSDYARRVEADADERVTMLEQVCTHETRFFREPQQFQFLEQVLCDSWTQQVNSGTRARRLRIWSAGCATGEEPFSLAMSLRSRLPSWQLEIIATDISRTALARCSSATWPIARANDIPERHLRRFMLQGTGTLAGNMRAADELRHHVRTSCVNLAAPPYGVGTPFDAIFCRNVLIYFRDELRTRVIERIVECLAPNGYLFLGHAEGLGSHAHQVRAVGPIVYQKQCASSR